MSKTTSATVFCSDCEGSGQRLGRHLDHVFCERCNGTGEVPADRASASRLCVVESLKTTAMILARAGL